MKILYACYGMAGLNCLYQLLNRKECNPQDIFVVTYGDPGNESLLTHLDALSVRYTTGSLASKEVKDELMDFSPDYMFSVYFRDVVGADVLRMVKGVSVNLHPSLLPDYKGCFSAPWALINGEKRTGISFHVMDTGVDTGNIILQDDIEIRPEETAFSLYHRLVALGTKNFSQAFNLAVMEGFKGISQESGGRRYKRGVPYNGYIDLNWGREKTGNFIRAMCFPPFPGAKLVFDGQNVEFKTLAELDAFCKKRGIKV